MTILPDKHTLLQQGVKVMETFCERNTLPAPKVWPYESATTWQVSACAYYRPTTGIKICVPRCAAIGTAGRSWSFPGYTVDRTPYGVIQHELGHHVDVVSGASQHLARRGAYWSEFSAAVRGQTGEKAITSYCPNDAEWFAEMFRVFVTNPDLLRLVRPRTHRELASRFKPVFEDSWRERLRGAPERTRTAAARQVEAAQ